MFRGREKELTELNRLYYQNQFQLFILYGRRRVGKTTLLKEFCKEKKSIFYSAEQSNEKMNLEKFSALVFQHYNEKALQTFASFEHAFSYINERQTKESLVLVFDEFPYLAAINPALMSILQHLIDHQLKESKLFLMKPFDYRISAKFLEGFCAEEKLLLYGPFGGTAMYLNQITKDLSVSENIKNLFLKTTSYLYEEPLLLLRQEVQQPGIYCAMIEAIAKGAVSSNEISQSTGEDTAKCLKYISTLRELGILYKITPMNEKENARKTQYRICDPLFRFWYRYVITNKTLLETDAYEIVWEKRIKPDLSNFMGHSFERICMDYLLWKNSIGALPISFTQIGSWWRTNPAARSVEDIDIIARDGLDYLFSECKWRNETFDCSVLNTLKERADVFSRKRNKTWYVLFSKSGFSDAVYQEAERNENIILVSLDDLFL